MELGEMLMRPELVVHVHFAELSGVRDKDNSLGHHRSDDMVEGKSKKIRY
jgi:hypothetical protein